MHGDHGVAVEGTIKMRKQLAGPSRFIAEGTDEAVRINL
jgi:hypothetical protein